MQVTKTVEITPSIAAATLEYSGLNRRLNPMRVNNFAEDMQRGRWKLTHQGIALDENGFLIDGQHRLQAIVKSGVTIKMNVTKGVSSDSMLAIDCDMLTRGPVAIAKLNGRDDATKDYAVAKIIYKGPTASTQAKVATQKLWEMVDAIKPKYDIVKEYVPKNLPAIVVAVILRASYTHDVRKMLPFMEACGARYATEARSASACLLMDAIRNKRLPEGSTGTDGINLRAYQYALAENALVAFLEGRELTKLVPARGEKFVVPLEDVFN